MPPNQQWYCSFQMFIHTLRKRSKSRFSESAGQGQGQSQNLKLKQSEKQIFTLVLLITFVFLTLNIPTRILVFDMNFYSKHTAQYFAGLHLFFQVGEAHCKPWYQFLSVCDIWFKTDLRNLFISTQSKTAKSLVSNINTVSTGLPLDNIQIF